MLETGAGLTVIWLDALTAEAVPCRRTSSTRSNADVIVQIKV